MYLCMRSLGFGTNGFFVAIRSDSGCCDWWYYGTRYVGEAERVGFGGNTDIFGGSKSNYVDELHGTL